MHRLIHAVRTAGAISLKLSHGYEVREGADPIVDLVDTATEQFAETTTPGRYLVDVFPILRFVPTWFPGAKFHKIIKSYHETLQNMADIPHEFVKARMVS